MFRRTCSTAPPGSQQSRDRAPAALSPPHQQVRALSVSPRVAACQDPAALTPRSTLTRSGLAGQPGVGGDLLTVVGRGRARLPPLYLYQAGCQQLQAVE